MKVAYDLSNWDDVPHFPDDEHNDKLFGICTYIIDSDDIDSDNMFTDAELSIHNGLRQKGTKLNFKKY
jgi:hypothetical protein